MNEQWQDNTSDDAKRALAEWSHAVADETEAELQAIMTPEEYAWYRDETAASIHDTTNTAETYAALKAENERLRGLITTAVEHIKSECNANLIGYGCEWLYNLPADLQGYSRISVNADELNLMASTKTK